MVVDYRSHRLCSDRSRDVAMATNFRVKIGKIGRLLAFQNGLEDCHSEFQNFICDDLAILYVNVVNFGPVTPEFKNGKRVQPLVSLFNINFSDKLSQDPPNRFSPNFYRMIGI